MKKRLLILEDDQRLRKTLALDFSEKGYEVIETSTISDINQYFDYAIIDLRLGGEYGLHALGVLKEKSPNCRTVILTGYGSVATAVQAVKEGAVDYLLKPASVSTIESALLGENIAKGTNEISHLSRHEHEYIEFILARNNGNISQTAKDLGLHRQSLQRKLKKLP